MINFLRLFKKFDANIISVLSKKYIIEYNSETFGSYLSEKIIQTNYVINQFKGNAHEKGVVINNPVEVEYLSTNNSTSKKIVTLGKFVPQKIKLY
jgi:hypothetical protein